MEHFPFPFALSRCLFPHFSCLSHIPFCLPPLPFCAFAWNKNRISCLHKEIDISIQPDYLNVQDWNLSLSNPFAGNCNTIYKHIQNVEREQGEPSTYPVH